MSDTSNNQHTAPAHSIKRSASEAKESRNLSEVAATKASILIVGAGLAGWGVVDAIRAKDKDIPITLVTADAADRYHKPMLTMAISQNKTPTELIRATGAQAAQEAKITLLARTKVIGIDTSNKCLRLEASDADATDKVSSIHYDKLVLALGAHPIFPPSLPEDMVWHVNHIERFAQLQQRLASGKQKIAIVGAGMVGTEIAEDLLKAGHSVTLIDINAAPLMQMLPKRAALRVRRAVEAQGIRFLGNCMVTGITKLDDEQVVVAYRHKEDNSAEDELLSLTVDHVIASTGLTVDTVLPESAGIDYDRRTGIAVDECSLQTSQPDIYAIGDCMSIAETPCRYVAPLRAQAEIIANEILGQAHAGYRHKPPMIRLKNKAISVVATGTPKGEGDWQAVCDNDHELSMQQVTADGLVTATLTLKTPAV